MYIHKLNRETDLGKIVEFLRRNEFATLVAYDGEKPVASHLLMELVEEGENLFVNGHMSKANPLWKTLDRERDVLLIFMGPHTYISPTWYNHINVPTWNYQSVHLYGKPRVISDPKETYPMLQRLVAKYESATSYRLEALPPDFVEKEMKGIVAFQVEVTRIEANYKLSQNRDDENHRSIVAHLEERSDDFSHAVAQAMGQKRSELTSRS
ncbi:MAG TPA: FMN-binding negative transcriptional regulator [Anaerolineales bacterium]|nr:FMN-binding negative transcriptional regulator [Anaerolineales bacterium]